MQTAQQQTVSNAQLPARIRPSRPRSTWLTACILVAVVFGVFFRFYHVDGKVYWEDETYTSLHVLGETEAEVVAHADRYTDAAALRAVLHPVPALDRGVSDTLHSLAVEDPQHPPLYYVAGHLWVKLFGDSVASIRTLSAVIGVAALPCMYWLCLELFGSVLAAWVGVGLFAISPIGVLFSQEAREYELWSLIVIVMSATFLRALRVNSVAAWAAYATAFAAALYVFPVSGFLGIGNVLAAAVVRRARPRAIGAPIVASIAGGLLFVPWLAVVFTNFHTIDHAMGLSLGTHSSKFAILKQFIGLFKLNFLDFNLARHAINILLSVPVLGLIGFAFYDLCRHAPRRTETTFLVTTTLFASLPFVLPDLLLGQHFTGNPRYFMPLYLAIDLVLVALFSANLAATNTGRRRAWSLVFSVVLVGRIASCAASANADTWWSKFDERSIDVARAINAADRPVLISTEFMERPLSLSNYLDPKVAVQLRPRCYLCRTDAVARFDLAALQGRTRYSDVFVLAPSPVLENDVKAAIARANNSLTYRCIDDKLDEGSRCADTLHMWPPM